MGKAVARQLAVRSLGGGWLRADGLLDDGLVYVRFQPSGSGRVRMHELYVDSDVPITPEAVRALPLAELEGIANLDPEAVVAGMGMPGGERLSILASHLDDHPAHPGFEVRDGGSVLERTWRDRAAEDWVIGSWLASLPLEDREAAGLGGVTPPARAEVRPGRRVDDFRLTEMPPGGRLDEDFMRKLARAYVAAIARGEDPNVAIARSVGYPQIVTTDPKTGRRTTKQQGVRTVQSWVYRARKRQFLPPAGRQGAVG